MTNDSQAGKPSQHPTQQKVDRLRQFSALARKHRKAERDRRAESQWRKRSCALFLGLFKESEPDPETGRLYTDEAALDAFAPHGSERIENRYFTAEMEARELEAWAHVMAAREKGEAEANEARRAYLRLVEALDRAAQTQLQVKALAPIGGGSAVKTFAGMSGPPKLKGAMRVRRAA